MRAEVRRQQELVERRAAAPSRATGESPQPSSASPLASGVLTSSARCARAPCRGVPRTSMRERSRVAGYLERAGVDPIDAEGRVNALSSAALEVRCNRGRPPYALPMSSAHRFAIAVSLLLATACSGGPSTSSDGASSSSGASSSGGATSGGPRTGTPCQQLAQAICPQLQACPVTAGSSKCKYIEQDGTLGISCPRCVPHFEKNVCGDTSKTDTLFQACLAAIDAKKATCSENPLEANEMGLLLPPECHTLLDCNVGPCND